MEINLEHDIEAQIAAATAQVQAIFETGATVVAIILSVGILYALAKPVASTVLEYYNSAHRRG